MIRRFGLIIIVYLLFVSTIGCDAFIRKFTRKPKPGDIKKEELVLVPEEYKGPQMSKEELYRQYFLFWNSWQDELIVSLSQDANHKKQVDCIEEAIKNLSLLMGLLNDNKQKNLDIYIKRSSGLKEKIARDFYGNEINANRQDAERIKRGILKDFSYQNIKSDLR